MSRYRQEPMFNTEDLPLFSGTAPRATTKPFDPTPFSHTMFNFKCRFCLDTGRVKVKRGVIRYCWCAVGQQLRAGG